MKGDTQTMDKQLKHEITRALLQMNEEGKVHLPLDREYMFFNAVISGDEARVMSLMEPLTNENMGKLSNDPVRNLRYHLIITIALTTRFCIEAGLDSEKAYTISDLYIQKCDRCRTADEITRLHRKVIKEYTETMHQNREERIFSLHITRIRQYIDTHLHKKISLDMLADKTGLSKNYMCSLFRSEMNMTINSYIQKEKIRAASDLLAYTDYALQDISEYLAFSSLSYFIRIFKAQTGTTPGTYRKKHYGKHFSKNASAR